MKKKTTKKLVLNKQTMANLTNEEQERLQGGAGPKTNYTGLGPCACTPSAYCSPPCYSTFNICENI
jgi:hypothetical protein